MRQTALWIDHHEAKVFQLDGATSDKETIPSAKQHVHRHPKSQETRTHNHPDDEPWYFDQVIAALEGDDEILIVGPSVTKLHFLRYVQKHAPTVAAHVVGIESADHPTDKQLIAHIRHYFHGDPPRLGVGR